MNPPSPPDGAENGAVTAPALREQYESGATVAELVTASGLSYGTVINRLREAGTVMRSSWQTRRMRDGKARRNLATRLRRLYEQHGATFTELAQAGAGTRRAARRLLIEAGGMPRTTQQTLRIRTAADATARQKLAVSLRGRYESGASVPELAKECNYSVATVYRLLHQAGTRMRPQHRHGPARTSRTRSWPAQAGPSLVWPRVPVICRRRRGVIPGAAARHAPRPGRCACAPPPTAPDNTPLLSGDRTHVNEFTRHKTLAAAAVDAWDAFVIDVAMLKGGTGKTTSAWFIALYYAVVLGLPTLLLDADATSQSAYDWFKVAKAEGFEIPDNLVVERYPFDDIAEYIRAKRAEFGAIVVDAGGGSAKLFHEAVTEANRLIVPVAPTKIERRKLVATFDEAERAAARNERDVTAHVVLVKADDRTSLPRTAKDRLLQPAQGEGIGPDHDEPFPLAETVIHSWVHYMEAFGEIPTELSEYAALMKELNA